LWRTGKPPSKRKKIPDSRGGERKIRTVYRGEAKGAALITTIPVSVLTEEGEGP